MKKKEIKYAVVLVLVFLAAVLFEIYRPKPVDWSPTLSNRDRIPYGTHVLYSLMSELFPGQQVVESRVPAYNFLQEDSTLRAHYIFIAEHVALDGNDAGSLLGFAAAGNSVFIASRYMYALWPLLDSLHVHVRDTLTWDSMLRRDTTAVFVNPQLNTQPYYFRRMAHPEFFVADSLCDMTILGKNGMDAPNFVRVKHGEGAFYLHLLPLAFSNYHILNDTTSGYAFKALSYLPPDRTVIWDEYVNQGRVGDQSMLRVVMSFPPLRWAYYVTVFGILLFVIFESKRRQRVIPVIRPLKNTTLEFLDVVSRLYFQKQDHKNMAHKKIVFFMEQIRTQYNLLTNRLDEDFAAALSRKSGYPADRTKYLIWKINQIDRQNAITAEELLKLNEEIENFYTNIRQGNDSSR